MSSFRFLIVALWAVLLCGCTAVTAFRGIPLDGDNLYVSGLPPIRQNKQYACGPACVAAVAAYWGVGLTEFKSRCPVTPRDTTASDLKVMAEALGLRAFVVEASFADLEDNLRQGRPVIVMITQPPDPMMRQAGVIGAMGLALSEHLTHPPHWVVVLGCAGGKEVIIHDPASGLLQVKREIFEKWRKRMGNVSVLIASA
jgi:predicted double-glycine peptidase